MLIRLAVPADAAACLDIYRPFVETTHVSFETEPPSLHEFAGRIESTLALRPWIVALGDEGIAGYAYASPVKDRAAYQWSVEVALYVAERARRRGLGRSMYEALFRVLRGQGFVNAVGVIALPNPASIALHEALGFEKIAHLKRIGFKLGEWRDVGWWELALGPMPKQPLPPAPLASCRAQADAWLASDPPSA
jgi:phosphinothricin acetyltransferase